MNPTLSLSPLRSSPAPTLRHEVAAGLGVAVRYRRATLDPIVPRFRHKRGRWRRIRDSRRRQQSVWTGWKNNLILTQGLDGLTGRSFANSFTNIAIGTGNDPVKRDSGAVTFTRADTTVTASASFFEAADVGRLLKFDTGEEMLITGYSSGTQVTVDTSGALGAAEGTIWYVNRTGLETEVKRSATYSTSAGECQTTLVGNTFTLRRTVVFTAEAAPITYTEIGWSHTAVVGANLFGMDLIPGGGDFVNTGQQYKVQVEIVVTLTPYSAAQVVGASPITGWATATGTQKIEAVALDVVAANGTTTTSPDNALEPAYTKRINLSIVSTALQTSGITSGYYTGNPLASVTATPAAYVNGSFTRTWSGTFAIDEGNSTAIRSLFFGPNSSPGFSAFRYLTDSVQTKAATHTLSITFRLTWGRVLTN